MAGGSTVPPSPISARILDVRANLYAAVEALERSLEYGNQLLSVTDAAALVVAQISELKQLLALLEYAAGADESRAQPPQD